MSLSPFELQKKFVYVDWRWRALIWLVRPRPFRRALEKEWHRDVKEIGRLLQPASADPVGTFLIFLHLLESEAERIGEFLLAQVKHHATHAQAAADVLVDGIWFVLSASHTDSHPLTLLRISPPAC